MVEQLFHPIVVRRGCGVEKMYWTLRPEFLGRDRFIEQMMKAGFRLKRRRNYHRTTYAGKIRYPNLIKGAKVAAPSVIWQSDITYIRVDQRFYYAVFISDVYSKQIVGYHLSRDMRSASNVKALISSSRREIPFAVLSLTAILTQVQHNPLGFWGSKRTDCAR